jgi:DNA-binding LytR/AlgR family response regulator
MVMRVLIADDEPVALERLKITLACAPDVELVGCASNGREARQLMRELQPDVVILDIQMPGLTGLEAARAVADSPRAPVVIFLTAFSEHAVDAFALNAVDYLLKPVSFDRFREALKRAEDALRRQTAEERLSQLHSAMQAAQSREADSGVIYRKEFWLKAGDTLHRCPVDMVDMIEAEGDYVALKIEERTHLLKLSITALARELDPARFARVHRSVIVNLSRVRSLRRRGRGAMSLSLVDGAIVPVGPNYADAVLEALQAKRWR